MAVVVWLKRDLRLADHPALAAAASSGLPVVVLYVYEPSLLQALDFSRCHLEFINQSLRVICPPCAWQRTHLQAATPMLTALVHPPFLPPLGAQELQAALCGGLVLRHGEAVAVLGALHGELKAAGVAGGISQLYSHQETGTPRMAARNAAVAEWARRQGVEWQELPQTGVVRGLTTRDGWAKQWTTYMELPLLPPPAQLRLAGGVDGGRLMEAAELGVQGEAKPEAMRGGAEGLPCLAARFRSFMCGCSLVMHALSSCCRGREPGGGAAGFVPGRPGRGILFPHV